MSSIAAVPLVMARGFVRGMARVVDRTMDGDEDSLDCIEESWRRVGSAIEDATKKHARENGLDGK